MPCWPKALPNDTQLLSPPTAKPWLCSLTGHTLEELQWPAEPLRTTMLRGLGKLGMARYAQKYEAVQVRRLQDAAPLSVTYIAACRTTSRCRARH